MIIHNTCFIYNRQLREVCCESNNGEQTVAFFENFGGYFMTKEYQRVAISKRMLKEALLDLLKDKPIDAVTVSELCQMAQINRTTFYRHYETP